MEAADVVDFWFNELNPRDWFQKNDEVDALITSRFAALHRAAGLAELWSWRSSAAGALAEIIVLDQFSRNIYRNDARAFATDGMALVLAQEAVRRALDRELSAPQKSFMYMPFMHSESPVVHETAVKLFSQPGLEENLRFELQHRDIIARFGRYPHRNAVLCRASTPAEIDFLKTAPAFW
ncbi:MAG TPA: DUF924 family protein [Candidatus Binatia bacterium]|nr:DUF924 family protein [Candidatus Binatia bacterium]